jgi:uncharacterized Zn-binding protein involved in type VI secretion
MARGVARVGDRTHGTCYGHITPLSIGGTITSGSGKVITNGKRTARIGDTVTADCGHTGTIVSGSGKDIADNGAKPVARLNDKVSGTYVATIITASDDVIADE